MKKLLFLLPLLLFSKIHFGQTHNHQLQGVWLGEEASGIVKMTFDNEGYCTIEENGQAMGGKTFIQDGLTMSMRYAVNYDKSPMEIDFIVSSIDMENISFTMRGAFAFNGEHISLCMNEDESVRPKSLTSADCTDFVFYRQN